MLVQSGVNQRSGSGSTVREVSIVPIVSRRRKVAQDGKLSACFARLDFFVYPISGVVEYRNMERLPFQNANCRND